MKKVIVFLIFSAFCFSENSIAESKFINIGNMKIVREQNIKITKEVIDIKFLKDNKISVKTRYFLENTDNRDIKETYIFSLDQYPGKVPAKYIEKIKYKIGENDVPNLRAVISFDEDGRKIQREWFGIGGKIQMGQSIVMQVSYILKNIEDNELNYSFNIKNNFLENKADTLEINIDKGERNITSIAYGIYEFYENSDGTYYMNAKDVQLDGILTIKYE
ncbi:hypothetical protein [Sebaldella sp. S0638]|uniref:hypothetical protein n=1 Tax=Sebaldella sp. S0638 TaxID=2957809 RepID=UPI00209E9E5D|nr:hypothetical protein [Sebaldella sp. S0638]MCP1223361.1 hypothetical protein [Sebaldella sp. S0638]